MRRISTKQKKKLYSFSSLLFHLLVFVTLLISLGTDADESNAVKNKTALIEEEKEEVYPFKTFLTNMKR
jgi:hypothetical protein